MLPVHYTTSSIIASYYKVMGEHGKVVFFQFLFVVSSVVGSIIGCTPISDRLISI